MKRLLFLLCFFGASLSACAEALRHAGAVRVDVAVVARTPASAGQSHSLR